MRLTHTTALFFILVSVNTLETIVKKYVTVGDSVEFPASDNCTDGKEFKLMTENIKVTVAARVDGVWTPGEDYKNRIEHLSSSSLKLTGVTLRDNKLKGMYEFMCDNNPVTFIHLNVSTAFNLSETEGETGGIKLNQTSLRPPPVNSTQRAVEDEGRRNKIIVGVVLSLAAAAAVAVALTVILVGRYRKSRRSEVLPGPGDGRATDVEMRPLNGEGSPGPLVNGGAFSAKLQWLLTVFLNCYNFSKH
ncbi:uncharacterized protein LOC127363696 [Dicentrarchus labrax]|uniref:uncharacterized protein LOC127363696 n=1 Tax=Dicentrarchus labrax TaxID=13489 RepID=UPI0021F5A554|nr:uncharacterized protein LOC127363696 [Dicentrarchus labrax]